MIEYFNYYSNMAYTWWEQVRCKHRKGFETFDSGDREVICPICKKVESAI